ncbi:MAG: hypothetical protein J5570_08850 [Lachnospiraceae bacterium]|nr:hypothetical protein [Lachnospiraceae bacterium]
MTFLKRLGKTLTNNIWLKVLALVLAFVLWVLVAQINNPVRTLTYNNVKVTLVGGNILEAEGKVYQVLNNSDIAKVTVRAPESVINSITASDITAIADLSQINEDGTVPIIYSLERAESITADHDTVSVAVENRITKYVNITWQTVGSVGEGCVQGKVNLERNRIEVTGPESAVNRVSYAQVTIDLDDAVKTISADMEIILYDTKGNRVESDMIVKQTDYVTTTVTVLSTKTVPVYASTTGEPAPGFVFTGDITVNPAVVTIAGDTSVLNTITRIDITNPVDISSAKSDTTATFHLTDFLPAGVSFEDPDFDDEVDVTANIEKNAEKTLTVSADHFVLTDIPEGYEAEIAGDEEITVRLVGLGTELNAVSAESLRGLVEVDSYLTSVYGDDYSGITFANIPVKFFLSEHVEADPVYIRVQLTLKDET